MRAAEALRREGDEGRIVLIGVERHWPPFDRPPLSKQVLLGKWERDKALLRTELDPATDDGLELVLGRRAVGLDAAAREVTLDDGATVAYDGLIVATGATPRRLPGYDHLAGIHVLRTVDDCDALRADLVDGRRVAVIGAGFIGCEVAAACRTLGHEVALVEALPLPLVRVLGEQIGAMTAALHREHGVAVHLGVGVDTIEGDERVRRVRLADGTQIDAEVVVVGIGVTPATEWLEGSGVVLDNGVVCSAALLAEGVSGIAAAGDIARWPNPAFGGQVMRIEHWTNAAEQAEHAARSLLAQAGGRDAEPFESIPYFWSEQYGVRLQMVGTWATGDAQHVVEGDPLGEERKGVIAFVRDGTVVGALCINRPNRTLLWRNHIADRATWPIP